MRLDKVKYPPEPQCNDDLIPEDLPDALGAWEHECDGITIAQLQSELDKAKEEVRSWRSVAERLETEKQALERRY